MTDVLQQKFSYCFTWSTNQLLLLNIFSFSSDFFTYQLNFFLFWLLNLLSSTTHYNWLICFWVSWSHFSVLFWMLRMLVTMNKWCHVPHASRITTLGKIFTKIPFGLPKEWVRSWSHAFLITNAKTLAKKLLTVSPKILRR